MNRKKWSEEKVETLMQHTREGKSDSEIAIIFDFDVSVVRNKLFYLRTDNLYITRREAELFEGADFSR